MNVISTIENQIEFFFVYQKIKIKMFFFFVTKIKLVLKQSNMYTTDEK
jgi:hypothetical protein